MLISRQEKKQVDLCFEWKKPIVTMGFFLALSLIFFSSQSWAVDYTYTYLNPPGWTDSYATGINDAGVVVGSVCVTSDPEYGCSFETTEGFIYDKGTYTYLNASFMTPFGGAYTVPTGINNAGILAGEVFTDYYDFEGGFIYDRGTYTELTPPGWEWTWAYGINNAGVVVGAGNVLDFSLGAEGFIYDKGTYTYLLPPGWTDSYAYGINDAGVVVGGVLTNNGSTAEGFIYDRGTYAYLLPPGSTRASATGINNSGVVIGSTYGTTDFIYDRGTYTYLNPPGWTDSYATGINDAGVVVGVVDGVSTTNGSTAEGFIYDRGTYTYLLPPGWSAVGDVYINNAGVVVGWGYDGTGTLKSFIVYPQGIVACNGVALSGNVMVDSYYSTNGSYASQVGARGHVWSNGNVQTCTADSNITLSGDAAIYGNASAAETVITSGHAKVHGITSQNQSISVCDPLNVASLVETNKPSGSPTPITLSGKQTKTLVAPGTFYLTGLSLSGQSKLTVTGTGNATMFIDGNLSLSGQSSFIITNGTKLTIYITGNISITGGGISNQGSPIDLTIYASASKGTQVAISGNSDLSGALYAPLSNISITGNSVIMGVVRGMTVTGSGNAAFHCDVATEDLLVGW